MPLSTAAGKICGSQRAALWAFLPLLLGVFSVPAAVTGQEADEPVLPKIHGTWRLDFNSPDALLRLTRNPVRKGRRGSEIATPFRLEDCLGLARPSGVKKAPVRFQVARDAGVFKFKGAANNAAGAGSFVFEAEEDFVEYMPEGKVDQFYLMTIRDVSVEFVRGLEALGYRPRPSIDQLIALRAKGTDLDFVIGLKRLGYEKLPVEDLLRLRSAGVTIEFVRKSVASNPRVSIDELIETRLKDPAKTIPDR